MQPRKSSGSSKKRVRFLKPIIIYSYPLSPSSTPVSRTTTPYVPVSRAPTLLTPPRMRLNSGMSHEALPRSSATRCKFTSFHSEDRTLCSQKSFPSDSKRESYHSRISNYSLDKTLCRGPRMPRSNPPASPPSLHFLLHCSDIPSLYFDVREPPSTIWTRYHSLAPDVFYNPATTPPVSQLILTSPLLQKNIHVSPTDHGNHSGQSYVSVTNVLETIYYTLHQIIRMDEYECIGRTHGVGAQVRGVKAYEDRIRRIKDGRAREEERLKGMRRVDFLQGQTRFLGLTMPVGHRKNREWVMEFH